jgi:diguanylate cyclase (GGDEF)-like protein
VKVAEHMKALIRKQDSIGRWGGEDFILLLPETTAIGAGTLAEKIRTAIPNQKYIYKNSEISIP